MTYIASIFRQLGRSGKQVMSEMNTKKTYQIDFIRDFM